MVIREKIREVLDEYVDEHRANIYGVVDKNLIKLKDEIVEQLPDRVMEFLRKRVDDGDDQNDTFLESVMKFVGSISKTLSDDFKEGVRQTTREILDDVTASLPDDLTNSITIYSKKVILDVTTDSDDEGEDEKKKKSSFFKEFDLGFLKDGKEGIITRIVELIKTPVHEAGDNIKKKISTRLSGQVRDKLINEATGGLFGAKSSTSDRGISDNSDDTDGGDSESRLGKIFGMFKKEGAEGEKKGNFIDRIFDKLPNKIEEILTPYIIEFEQRVIEHVENELTNNIFKNDKFKGRVKSTLSKYEDDDSDDDNDKNTLTSRLGSMFKSK